MAAVALPVVSKSGNPVPVPKTLAQSCIFLITSLLRYSFFHFEGFFATCSGAFAHFYGRISAIGVTI
jgi:hypothetical protein